MLLFDAVAGAEKADRTFDGLSEAELFELVIPRLRVLVPREVHIQGERQYVAAKIVACLEAKILQLHPRRDGRILILGPQVPRVRYPDGTIRDYTPGLEAARERLESDENGLQDNFDVRRVLGTTARLKSTTRYKNLIESMREHGFLEYFPIVESRSGVVLDGAVRKAAAEELGIPLQRRTLPPRRDTPLQQALLVIDLNGGRLSEEEVAKIREAIASRCGREWSAIADDLALTRDWRGMEPKNYSAKLDVKLVTYPGRPEAKVQITTDGTRVMLRSAMREAGLPEYARTNLLPYVAWEEARTQFSGRKAIFVAIENAVSGIAEMQADRRSRNQLIDNAWDDLGEWLSKLLDNGDRSGRFDAAT